MRLNKNILMYDLFYILELNYKQKFSTISCTHLNKLVTYNPYF